MKRYSGNILGSMLLIGLLPVVADAKVTNVEDYKWKGYEGAANGNGGQTSCPRPLSGSCEIYGTEWINGCRNIVNRRDSAASYYVFKNCTGDKGDTMEICDGSSRYPIEMSNKCDCPTGMIDVTQNGSSAGSNVTTITYDGGSKICATPATTASCDEYNKSPSDCYGVATTVCPSDPTKVSCADKPCAVGDVVYADGRCYGNLPVPTKTSSPNSETIDVVGVVVDPVKHLAVLPYEHTRTLAWQLPVTGSSTHSYDMAAVSNSGSCMNWINGSYPNYADYRAEFPAPTDTTFNACGVPTGTSNTSFNWDMTPLLQKILSPLKNFTPIKSAHAAAPVTGTGGPDIIIINPDPCLINPNSPECGGQVDPCDINPNSPGCGGQTYSATYGCAIPNIATSQTDCASNAGENVGGKFYTQQLMNFQSAHSNTTFTVGLGYSGTTTVTGIKFPAAEHCHTIDGISVKGESVTPFLPSVADLYKMLDPDNILAIFNGLAKTHSSCANYANYTDMNSVWSDFEDTEKTSNCPLLWEYGVAKATNGEKGWWSSQQNKYTITDTGNINPGTHTFWNKASKVGFDNSSSPQIIDLVDPVKNTHRTAGNFVYCFVNY